MKRIAALCLFGALSTSALSAQFDNIVTSGTRNIEPYPCRKPETPECNIHIGIDAGHAAQGSHNTILGNYACTRLRGDFNICMGDNADAEEASRSLILPGHAPIPLNMSDTELAALTATILKHFTEMWTTSVKP